MASTEPITGACFCGAVKYRINGALSDARSCHCSRCRKAFSSQASAYALVESSQFEWISGEDLLTAYLDENGHGLRFCGTCGSTLCGVVGGEIHGVTLGCVNGDPGVEITRHIHVASKAGWEILPDGVPKYPEGGP